MSTESWLWVAVVLLGAMLVLVIFLSLFLAESKSAMQVLLGTIHEQRQRIDRLGAESTQSTTRLQDAREILAVTESRYQISVTDWGPDFTGEDGTLPRWRWVVQKADAHMEAVLNGDYHLDEATGVMRPMFESSVLMLGNEPHPDSAVLAALEWVEQQQSSVYFVWEPPRPIHPAPQGPPPIPPPPPGTPVG